MSCSCKYSVALPHSVKGWSAEYDYGISSSYCFGQTKLRRCTLKQLWTTDDGHPTITIAHIESMAKVS